MAWGSGVNLSWLATQECTSLLKTNEVTITPGEIAIARSL
jgi:hypothetical protein